MKSDSLAYSGSLFFVCVCVFLAQGSADEIIDYPVKVSAKAPATLKART